MVKYVKIDKMEIKLTIDLTPRLEQVVQRLTQAFVKPVEVTNQEKKKESQTVEQLPAPEPQTAEPVTETVSVAEVRSWSEVVQEYMQNRLQQIIGIGKDLNALTGVDADIKNKVLKTFIGIARKLEKGKKPTQLSEVSQKRFLIEVDSVGVNDRGEITRAPLFDVTSESFVE